MTQNLSIIYYLRKCGDSQTALINDSFFYFLKKYSLADVGQIVSRNMMHDAECFCFTYYLDNAFFFFSVLNLDMIQNSVPENIVYA